MLLNLICVLSALVALGICAAAGGFSSLAWLWLLPLGFVGSFLLCAVVCFLYVWLSDRYSDPNAQYDSDDPHVRGIIRWYAPAVFRLLGCKIEASGTEKLPADGRFLLVSNHLADLDPGIFFITFPHNQLSFIAKKEVQDMPIVGRLMRKILCQFVDRENDREALKTILRCISILKEDKASIAVFPEGRKSTDQYLLHHFRPGVFKIAQKANVPIVVCTLRGTQNILPNAKKLRRTPIRLNLVEVIPAGELKGVTAVDIAHRVHAIMARDLGAEHVAED
ncbi:MAG: 1-acyl-sn-glycerol-3-phosphate acyltransferase [Oscillospiraceae bacterium]|nr:1-acyl-sn-glycerol-3-phosphate acyltransferase [Oscillospiraceae bacterium]